MERLVEEKIELATELGASPEILETVYNEEKSRQRMVLMEACIFFLVLAFGLWLVYRALAKEHELRNQQKNFIMAVTHELKTPLASINIYLDSLLSSEIPEDKKRAIIPKIKDDVNRLKGQVQDVLEASAAGSVKKLRAKDEMNFSNLVKERIGILKSGNYTGSYTLIQDISEGIRICGDSAALGRAIDAILENSIIHNRDSKVELTVNLNQMKDEVILEVSDNGVGVEREELEKIFEQFYRVGSEMTRTAQGTGLGLYICREIVRAHGGRVFATAEGLSKGIKIVMKLKAGSKVEKTFTG